MAEHEGNDKLSTLGGIVPSVYYDLIARVCGGAPFLALVLSGQGDSLRKAADFLGTAGVMLGAVLGAYVIGMLLTAVSLIVCSPINVIVNRWYGFRAQERNEKADRVDKLDSAMGGTLLKMAAEEVLCQNLLSGFIVFWFASKHWPAAFDLQTDPARRALFAWPVSLWVTLVLVLAVIHRTSAHAHRVKVFYDILHGDPAPRGSHMPAREAVHKAKVGAARDENSL